MKRLLHASLIAMSVTTTMVASVRVAADVRPAAYAYQYGELETTRTFSMAGAARVFGINTSAIATNPANVGSTRSYTVEAQAAYDPLYKRLQYGGSIHDSVTSKLAMGVMFVKTDQGIGDSPYQRTNVDLRVAASYPVSERLFFGLGGRYLKVNQDGVGILGASPISRSASDEGNFKAFTFDAGITAVLSETFRAAFVGHNLTNNKSSLAPMMFMGAIGFQALDALSSELNLGAADSTTWGTWKMRLQLGTEYIFSKTIAARIGYTFDQGSLRHAFTLGLGYVSPRISVDVGARMDAIRSSSDDFQRVLNIMLGIRLAIDPSTEDNRQSRMVTF